jgi:asparagine synthase (glutamine-hydrolysing)
LEARVPFLDENFVNLYYKIDPELIIPTKERMEKFLIRRAFEVVWPDVLPKSVLWRKKEAFSDGVSSKEKSWYQMVRSHVSSDLYPAFLGELNKKDEEVVKSVEKVEERFKFEGLQPVCVESQYYRVLHTKLFKNNHTMFSHYWLPSWANTNEPSARILRVYSETATN